MPKAPAGAGTTQDEGAADHDPAALAKAWDDLRAAQDAHTADLERYGNSVAALERERTLHQNAVVAHEAEVREFRAQQVAQEAAREREEAEKAAFKADAAHRAAHGKVRMIARTTFANPKTGSRRPGGTVVDGEEFECDPHYAKDIHQVGLAQPVDEEHMAEAVRLAGTPPPVHGIGIMHPKRG